ncbi:hypothetical protein BY458DRAFT_519697 [Sporodiniella umbellata]|nr:hypothetical protein BY458DRAFT_519697 [Sporodiniella umbellata]
MSYINSQQQQQQTNTPLFEGSPTRTLWMGELDTWMDETYLRQLWWNFGQSVSCRLYIDKYGASYAFVEFPTHEAASQSLLCYNGTQMPNTNKIFKLNWSNRDGNGIPLLQRPMLMANFSGDYCIFVGDLGVDVNDAILLSAFQSRYKSTASAKVMVDPATGVSRKFGFVKFFDQIEQQRSLEEMHGVYVGSSRIRVSVARPKAKLETAVPTMNGIEKVSTIFVGGLNSTISEDELRSFFCLYGTIVAVKIIPLKNIAFIQYETRQSAEKAIIELNGSHLGGAKLRLSFGRTQLSTGPSTLYAPMYQAQSSAKFSGYQPAPAANNMQPYPLQQSVDLVDPNSPISLKKENTSYLAQQDEIMNQWVF